MRSLGEVLRPRGGLALLVFEDTASLAATLCLLCILAVLLREVAGLHDPWPFAICELRDFVDDLADDCRVPVSAFSGAVTSSFESARNFDDLLELPSDAGLARFDRVALLWPLPFELWRLSCFESKGLLWEASGSE